MSDTEGLDTEGPNGPEPEILSLTPDALLAAAKAFLAKRTSPGNLTPHDRLELSSLIAALEADIAAEEAFMTREERAEHAREVWQNLADDQEEDLLRQLDNVVVDTQVGPGTSKPK